MTKKDSLILNIHFFYSFLLFNWAKSDKILFIYFKLIGENAQWVLLKKNKNIYLKAFHSPMF